MYGGLHFLGKVAVLDPLVAQQVAAGEVVDRPASVVKELSENALYASATCIEVEIADGGRERMLVRDNGSGMSEEDSGPTHHQGTPAVRERSREGPYERLLCEARPRPRVAPYLDVSA
jgi:Histidine kinase-, DNA gyrase B-, and HSP90-like ATPase